MLVTIAFYLQGYTCEPEWTFRVDLVLVNVQLHKVIWCKRCYSV